MSADPTQAMTNNVATLANAGIILGVAGLTRDLVREFGPNAPRKKRAPQRKRSLLEDPFGDG